MNEKKISLKIQIPRLSSKERLDQTLSKVFPEYSRTQLKNWIDEGLLKVNQLEVKPKMKVAGGELITLETTITANQAWQAEAIPLQIIYEDNDVLLINKPKGMVTHPAPGNRNQTLLNAILYHDANLSLLPRAGILHRLDKNTSGLLLVAKNMLAFKILQSQLKKRKIVREYKTIVTGVLISGGSINAPIGRHPLKRKTMGVIETGKEAITHYRILEKFRHHTFLKIKLETGRTHQIRVHMAHIHHPIVGDQIYGGRLKIAKQMSVELVDTLRNFDRQALHAYLIGFQHPTTHQWMEFESQLPKDINHLLITLRKDSHEMDKT